MTGWHTSGSNYLDMNLTWISVCTSSAHRSSTFGFVYLGDLTHPGMYDMIQQRSYHCRRPKTCTYYSLSSAFHDHLQRIRRTPTSISMLYRHIATIVCLSMHLNIILYAAVPVRRTRALVSGLSYMVHTYTHMVSQVPGTSYEALVDWK